MSSRRKSRDPDYEPTQHPQRLLVLLICLAFSVVGITFIASGDPGARVTGVIAVVFFGGLGLVYWGITAPRRHDSSSEVEVIDDNRVVYPTSRTRAVLHLLGAGIFVGIGGAMMLGPALFSARIFPPTPLIVVGAVCVLYFGSLLVFYAGPSLIPGRLVLGTDGIAYDSGLGGFSGQWRDIAAVHTVNDRMLAVRASGTGRVQIRGLLRLFSLVQRRFWGVDVAIPLLIVCSDPATIEAAARDFHRANEK